MRARNRGLLFLAILLLLLFSIAAEPVNAQGDGRRFFPETGHWVVGDFLEYYERLPNPEYIYGYPITDEVVDQITGLTVQYFQRARFEYHPEYPPGQQVLITPLGQKLLRVGVPLDTGVENPACRTVPDNPYGPHYVCYSFLDFYLENGGLQQFGYPISGLELHGERVMQYFEFARIEWHPERRTGSRITLSNLGEVYYREYGLKNSLPTTLENNLPEQPVVLNLRAYAFSKHAVLATGDSQTVFVTVYDQNLIPVPQAQVNIIVKYPSGESEPYLVGTTDQSGLVTYTFTVKNAGKLGVVELVVVVNYGPLSKTTRTSFRTWW